MARIPIDTGVATTTTVKAAFDGINTMTSELYAALGDPANMVGLKPQGLRRATALTGAVKATYATIAIKFKLLSAPSTGDYVLSGSLGLALVLTSTGTGFFSSTDGAGGTMGGGLIPAAGGGNYAFAVGTEYTVHFAYNAPALTNRIWVNGVEQGTFTTVSPAGFDFPLCYPTGIACTSPTSTPSQALSGLLGFVWMGIGTTASWCITDPTKFYNNGSVYLGPSGQTPNGFQPIVFLGGTHLANEWLAGTNFGYGGNYALETA